MKLRFLLDENVSPKTADHLKGKGHDTQHVGEVKLGNANDHAVARFAQENNRIIVTFDKDFGQIYHDSGKASGIIIITAQNPSPKIINELLENLIKRVNGIRLAKALVILNETGYRIIES